jgi:hypothetical protein
MCAEALWALPASAVIAIVQLGLASNHWIERTFSKASSAAAITGLWSCTVSLRASERIAMVLLVRRQILSNGIAHSA